MRLVFNKNYREKNGIVKRTFFETEFNCIDFEMLL